MVKNYKKFVFGEKNKCGERSCNKQVGWSNFINYYACENHANQKWGSCEACQTEKTTHNVSHNLHWNDHPERILKSVKEAPSFQKEIIERLLAKNISESLRQKLNEAYQKVSEVEKNIPELGKLTSEYWEKKINLSNDFIQEKGGQQNNLYVGNLCDNCGDEVDKRRQELENDYKLNVLNKLIVFSPETVAQIEKEIGNDEVQEIAMNAALDEKIKGSGRIQARYHFMEKLPFYQNEKKLERNQQRKKTFFSKLQKYFQDNQIMQILEEGGFDYVIWYANGNVKNSSQLTEWSKLRTFFFSTSQKVLSLHEINRVLSSLDQVPNSSEKEEEKPLAETDKNKSLSSVSESGSLAAASLTKTEIKWLIHYFQENNIKEISLKNNELVVVDNNNESKNQLQINNDPQWDTLQNILRKKGKESLNFQELNSMVNPQNTPSGGEPKKTDYTPYLVVGAIGILITVLVVVSYSLGKRGKTKTE